MDPRTAFQDAPEFLKFEETSEGSSSVVSTEIFHSCGRHRPGALGDPGLLLEGADPPRDHEHLAARFKILRWSSAPNMKALRGVNSCKGGERVRWASWK